MDADERRCVELYLMRQQERWQLPVQALFVSICQLGLISLLFLHGILAQDAG